MIATALVFAIFIGACKKKDKTDNGLSITVTDCLNKPKPCLLKVRHQNGKTEELQYTSDAITVLTDANSKLNIDFIADGDTLSQEYNITKGISSVSPQFCRGFKFEFTSKIIGQGGTSLFGVLKTAKNYTVQYNAQNQSTYIVAPLQQLSVDATYPWQTGYFTLKLKSKNLSEVFSTTGFSVSLGSDTSQSYLMFGMYSTDSANYPHKHFMSNSSASIQVNQSKQLGKSYLEASFSPPQLPPGNFNVLNKQWGTVTGTDLLGGTLEVKQK